jgi:phosphate transport system permease protein
LKTKKKPIELVFHGVFLTCGLLSVAFVLGITVYLVVSGMPAILKIGPIDFLLGQIWNPGQEQFGILPFILTSVYGTLGAMVLGLPLGLLTAVFLSKYAGKKTGRLIRSAVELLAGIPSVVYGLVGMIVLVPAIQAAFDLSSGATLLAAILVLTVMILPYIVNVSCTALDAVPKEYEEGSLALGATKTETYFKVSIHAARSGIATAVIQGVGRALGEAMAIIMVAGNVANMPELFGSVRFLTTAIVSEMSYASYGSLHREALFSIGLVLFAFIILINVVLNLIVRRKDK